MTGPNRVVLPAVVVTIAIGLGTARAQTARATSTAEGPQYPQAETALGYTYVHPDGGGPDSNLGGGIQVAYNLAPWFGIAADGNISHFSGTLPNGVGWGQTEYGLLGGIRLAARQFGDVVPFAHLLAGYCRVNSDYSGSNTGNDFFAIQPGGGVDIYHGRFGARVEVSWRRMFDQSGAINRLRFFAGLVVRSDPKRHDD
jgi:hypothetical protein